MFRRYLNTLATALRPLRARLALPYSINGLWKADSISRFFRYRPMGGTSVKINPNDLGNIAGLGIGIVLVPQGGNDRIRKHVTKNLVNCCYIMTATLWNCLIRGREL